MSYDFASNNQIYQILFGKSIFQTRSIRVMFFYLGIHLELALYALFYDLEGGD